MNKDNIQENKMYHNYNPISNNYEKWIQKGGNGGTRVS